MPGPGAYDPEPVSTSPRYTLKGREAFARSFHHQTPGPGEYEPVNSLSKSLSFTLKSRVPKRPIEQTPGVQPPSRAGQTCYQRPPAPLVS